MVSVALRLPVPGFLLFFGLPHRLGRRPLLLPLHLLEAFPFSLFLLVLQLLPLLVHSCFLCVVFSCPFLFIQCLLLLYQFLVLCYPHRFEPPVFISLYVAHVRFDARLVSFNRGFKLLQIDFTRIIRIKQVESFAKLQLVFVCFRQHFDS